MLFRRQVTWLGKHFETWGAPKRYIVLYFFLLGSLEHFILLLFPVTGREVGGGMSLLEICYEPMKAKKETVSGSVCLFGLKVMKTGQLCIESGPWSAMAGAGPRERFLPTSFLEPQVGFSGSL